MKPEPFAPWQCPLCGEPLTGDTALKCGRNHSFDRAKEGYWHLLPVQSMRTKAPGDSKEMVAARRAFLNAGYYGIFGRALGELCLAYGASAGADAPLHRPSSTGKVKKLLRFRGILPLSLTRKKSIFSRPMPSTAVPSSLRVKALCGLTALGICPFMEN